MDGIEGAGASLGAEALARPVEALIEALNAFLEAQVTVFEPEVQPLVRYTFAHRGKRIRPLLVFYAGSGAAQAHNEALVRVAAIVELVHLATLVHDDILDGASLRHRTATAERTYGTSNAVLLGDVLFAQALKLAADFPTTDVCQAVAEATRRVCSGEIVQTLRPDSAQLPSEDDYYRVIRLKTAELFAVSARLGARVVESPPEAVEAAEHYARCLGLAYQVYDDLADLLAQEHQAGKTLRTDLETGKWTLPVLRWLQASGQRPGSGASDFDWPEDWRAALHAAGLLDGLAAEVERLLGEGELALAGVGGWDGARQLPQLGRFVRLALQRLMAPAAGAAVT